jgi:pyruvate kinase
MPMTTPAPAPIVRTKIVATIGPACREETGLRSLVDAGVDVFRLNMAHGSMEEHQETLDRVRRVAEAAGRPIGVLVDLAGPKIRLGEIPGGALECVEGAVFKFIRGTESHHPDEFTTTYERLIDELSVGDAVMLADGTISLVVEERSPNEARCRVVQGGLIRSRQGVNLPGVKLSVAAMSAADWQHAEWAAAAGADFVSLSFVRSAVEVKLLKELLRTRGSKARVVAKIEKREAIDNLDSIVDAADAVMVARGDLGVEIDVASMPMVQKQIIRACQRYQKPVIVATQMLDSMQHSRRPTRAETTDVANAILDGADACMLSGETAIGDHPRLVVEMMRRIASATEKQYLQDRRQFLEDSLGRGRAAVPAGEFLPPPEFLVDGLHPITQAVVDGASRIAAELDAKLVVVASKSGVTAIARSKRRGAVPTVGVSDDPATLRQMSLYWGVTPLAAVEGSDINRLLEHVTAWGLREGRLQRGDRILLVAGIGFGTGGHNMALVHEV